MSIELRNGIEAASPLPDILPGPQYASTVVYALPGCGLEATMEDDLDLPMDDLFTRTIAVPRTVAAAVDMFLDGMLEPSNAALELHVSPALIEEIKGAELDRGQRTQALYAAYRLPILPESHKAILVSGKPSRDAIADLAARILLARGAKEVVVLTAAGGCGRSH